MRGPAGPRGELGAEAEVGGEAAGQVRADRLAGRRGREHRPVLDVVGGGAGVAAGLDVHPVLLLGQEPEVVVALDRVAGVAVADAHLDVQDLLGRVPQLAQPAEAEVGLGQQRGVLAGEVAGGDQHQPVGVARGVAEFLVAAAGVEPAAGHVDRAAGPGQLAEQVVVAVVARVLVDVRAAVGEVGRLAVQDRGHDVGAVSLRGEVPHGVVHQAVVELLRPGDQERRRDGGRRCGDLDPVAARPPHGREVKLVHRPVVLVPPPDVVGRPAPVDHAAGADDREADAADRAGQHGESHLRAARGVPDLVDPHDRGGERRRGLYGRRGRCGGYRRRHGQGRGQGQPACCRMSHEPTSSEPPGAGPSQVN